MKIVLLTAGLFALSQAAQAQGHLDAVEAANRKLVLEFFDQMERNPRSAFEKYISTEFVEHGHPAPGTSRTDTIAFLEQMVRDQPRKHSDMLMTLAQGDKVALYFRLFPAPGAPSVDVVEIWRVAGGKIAEHWDVVAPSLDARESVGIPFRQ
jgi:predicted SnoaL-like aldol condensation-catalyzing enzyme